MRYNDRTLAGLLFFVASAQFFTAMMIGEAIQPGYNVGTNAISDLGVKNTALLFNASVIVVGLLSLAAGYLFHRTHGKKVFTILVLLSGIGAIIVGLFPENTGTPHLIGALLAFLFGGLAAIVAYPLEDAPLRYVSVVLGIVGLASLVLFEAGAYGGLGFGGMERLIVYPVLLWEVAFGGWLMATERASEAAKPGTAAT